MSPLRSVRFGRIAALVVVGFWAVPVVAHAAPLWGRPHRVSATVASSSSGSGSGAQAPSVAVNARGDGVVAWSRPDLTSGDNRIEVILRSRHGWGARLLIGRGNLLTGDAPSVAMDGLGDAFVAWVGSDNRTHAAVHPRGGAWSSTIVSLALGLQPVVAVDAGGDAALVWSRQGAVEVALRHRGGSWTSPRALSAPATPSQKARLAMSARGDLAVIWAAGLPGAHQQAQVRIKSAAGDFGPTQELSPASAFIDMPAIASDAAGDMVATWIAGIGTPTVLRAAVRRAGGGSFGPPKDLARQSLMGPPAVVVSRRGRAVVAWSHGVVDVAELSASGHWSRPRRISARGAAILSTGAAVAADPAGDATVVWVDFFGIEAADRLSGRGWRHPVRISSRREQDAVDPAAALAARRRGLVVWTSTVPGTRRVVWAALRR